MTSEQRLIATLAACAAVLTPMPAFAYIGPGAGLGALVIAGALVLGFLLLLVGLVWFPLKRAIKSRRADRTAETETERSQ